MILLGLQEWISQKMKNKKNTIIRKIMKMHQNIDPNNLAEVLQEDSIQAILPSNNYPTE